MRVTAVASEGNILKYKIYSDHKEQIKNEIQESKRSTKCQNIPEIRTIRYNVLKQKPSTKKNTE
jgi:hypothetical protein